MLVMDRIRLTLDLTDRARRALNIIAARTTKTAGEVVEAMLEAQHPEDLAIADRSIEEYEPAKSKRGRKPKGKAE